MTQQLDNCACLPYRLTCELLARHAGSAQELLHCTKTTQHSTQEADVRCFCILCVLQETFPDAHMELWCLVCPMTCLQIQQNLGPARSACHICPAQVLVHKASLQSRQIRPSCQTHKGNGALCQAIYIWGKGASALCKACCRTVYASWLCGLLKDFRLASSSASSAKGVKEVPW